MPVYEYECNDCKTTFENLQSINDAALPVCINCKSNNVTKLISASSFKFKGTGFYQTDYKNKEKPEAKTE
jgi:putative FmdB family regulatory protein